ncbi:MAG TPA: hypothetical protein DCR55_01915 [Lentisphaeria bacterium]|nr:hypothetical protein [Lentisphaeria bacterium]
MKLLIPISIVALSVASLLAADFDFNDTPTGAEPVEGCRGRFDIVEVSEGDHALRVYADSKDDGGRARIALRADKGFSGSFRLQVDCRLAKASAAGRLFAISDWNGNQQLLRVDATGGKRELKTSSFENGKSINHKLCDYKPGEWLTFWLVVDRETQTYSLSVRPRGSRAKATILKDLKLDPNVKNAIFFDSLTWKGQGAYAFELDNIIARPN